MFTTLIVQPIFNLLVFITAILPGHNFGMAIIVFTLIIRLLMWPLVKKQLHHAKAMRDLAPELKKIKAATKGNRQEESRLTMELYKEKEINPFATIGVLLVQLPILFGLYASIRKLINDPHQIVTFTYPFLHHLSWIQEISKDIHHFDETLFGVVNLTKTALGPTGVYWPAMIIVIASAFAQYLQSKQLMPQGKDSRGLRAILRDAGSGSQTDQAEVSAAVSRSTVIFVPLIVFLVSLHLAVALPLYWLVSSTIAYIQQSRILEEDVAEAEAIADEPTPKQKPRFGKAHTTPSGLKVTRTTVKKTPQNTQTKASSKKNKRRKK
jgi:YidC/Oxa1 family membrane protein insertase